MVWIEKTLKYLNLKKINKYSSGKHPHMLLIAYCTIENIPVEKHFYITFIQKFTLCLL